ncbi:unnamed protein product [Tilletia controversa]|nr:unnamed protein product [Tilletia controversa]
MRITAAIAVAILALGSNALSISERSESVVQPCTIFTTLLGTQCQSHHADNPHSGQWWGRRLIQPVLNAVRQEARHPASDLTPEARNTANCYSGQCFGRERAADDPTPEARGTANCYGGQCWGRGRALATATTKTTSKTTTTTTRPVITPIAGFCVHQICKWNRSNDILKEQPEAREPQRTTNKGPGSCRGGQCWKRTVSTERPQAREPLVTPILKHPVNCPGGQCFKFREVPVEARVTAAPVVDRAVGKDQVVEIDARTLITHNCIGGQCWRRSEVPEARVTAAPVVDRAVGKDQVVEIDARTLITHNCKGGQCWRRDAAPTPMPVQ